MYIYIVSGNCDESVKRSKLLVNCCCRFERLINCALNDQRDLIDFFLVVFSVNNYNDYIK